ncbi:MAG: hypothetical protein JWQ72_3020 [Polaromonas sp.]|nr:hypothetical protein [Polaromonas sp.]
MNTFKRIFMLAISVSLAAPALLRAAAKGPVLPAEQSEAAQALAALRLFFATYAEGNQAQLELMVEPEMIGYSRLVDAARQAASGQKQIRVALFDVRTQVADGAVFVHARWEKRFVRLPAQPVLKAGRAMFTMKRSAAGWRLAGLDGDSPVSAD